MEDERREHMDKLVENRKLKQGIDTGFKECAV
jgi:hypothetical protein